MIKGSKLRRPNRRPPNRLQKALKRVQEVYDDTPLNVVGVKLAEFLLGAQAAVDAARFVAKRTVLAALQNE